VVFPVVVVPQLVVPRVEPTTVKLLVLVSPGVATSGGSRLITNVNEAPGASPALVHAELKRTVGSPPLVVTDAVQLLFGPVPLEAV